MKQLLRIGVAGALVAILACPSLAQPAGPFAKGLEALDRGDVAQALPFLQTAAASGDREAQFTLGLLYLNGRPEIPQDDAEALRLFRLAADQGFPVAESELGVMLATGRGVPADLAEGVRWSRRAADHGYSTAQYNLSVSYSQGQGIARNDVEAVRWLRLAADQGNANAEYNLGVRHAEGRGVKQDLAEARRLYRLAADRGMEKAQYNLGLMYAAGAGVPLDNVEATRWFKLSAEQGNTSAQYSLALMYISHPIGEPDLVGAYKWLTLASIDGLPDSLEQIKSIAPKMSNDQVVYARFLAAMWLPARPSREDALKAEQENLHKVLDQF